MRLSLILLPLSSLLVSAAPPASPDAESTTANLNTRALDHYDCHSPYKTYKNYPAEAIDRVPDKLICRPPNFCHEILEFGGARIGFCNQNNVKKCLTGKTIRQRLSDTVRHCFNTDTSGNYAGAFIATDHTVVIFQGA